MERVIKGAQKCEREEFKATIPSRHRLWLEL